MKKSLLFVAALFAAFAINAKEFTVDLSKAVEEQENGSATFSFASGELTVNWTVNVKDEIAGVEIPIDNLTKVTKLSYEYKGDGSGVGLIHYLRDEDGNRWWDSNGWYSLEPTAWTPIEVAPFTTLWDGQADADFGKKPFVKVGFIANPSAPKSGKFYLRNVKITADSGTGIDQISQEPIANSQKLIKDGQLIIIRNGVEYNAAGQMVK